MSVDASIHNSPEKINDSRAGVDLWNSKDCLALIEEKNLCEGKNTFYENWQHSHAFHGLIACFDIALPHIFQHK